MDSNSLHSFQIPGGSYGYTGVPVGLGMDSFKYTLATGLVDESGSTRPFARQLELCVKEIIKGLRHSDSVDQLVYRHAHFDTNFREVHGFKLLKDCNENDYDGIWAGGGQTALYNSCVEVIEATRDYADQMAQKHYTVNGVVYILSDGQHYLPGGPFVTVANVRDALSKAITSETLESLITILIGVNEDPDVRAGLEKFHREAGFTQFIPIEKADEKSLAKVSNFISRSIYSQSQAVGTGGPSQSLTF